MTDVMYKLGNSEKAFSKFATTDDLLDIKDRLVGFVTRKDLRGLTEE